MEIDTKKRKKIKTWDDAFRALAPSVRQQSVRVAEYTKVLFLNACQVAYYTKGRDKVDYMTDAYDEVAYKCGLYHQLGKAMLSVEYQLWRDDFTAEEKEYYYTYMMEGRKLVAMLQDWDEDEEDNIDLPGQMIRDACEQHLECWDGTGYPMGRTGESISTIAQIVGMALMLDRLASETRSEAPFEEAMGTIMDLQGNRFSDHMIDVLKDSRNELKEIFKKYIQYTKIIPATIPLVDKRNERPMGLNFRRAMLDERTDAVYEAVPWFTSMTHDKETETFSQMEGVLKRTGLLCDVAMYLLYEAADCIIRMDHCGYDTSEVILIVPDSFYFEPNAQYRLLQLYADQPINPRRLKLTVSAEFLRDAELYEIERLSEFVKQKISLVLDDYHPDRVSMQLIRDIGFEYVRISEEISDWHMRRAIMHELKQFGISIAEYGNKEELFSEEKLIHDLLAAETAGQA